MSALLPSSPDLFPPMLRGWPKPSSRSEIHAASFLLGVCSDVMFVQWEGGLIELINELCPYAAVAADMIDIAAAVAGNNYPGVVEYEVSELFGGWFVSTRAAGIEIEVDAAVARMRELIVAFFSDDERPALHAEIFSALDIEYLRRA